GSGSGSIGSNRPAFTSPAFPITIAGAPSRARSSRSSAAGSMAPTGSAHVVRRPRPSPSIPSAFRPVTWTNPLVRTGACGNPASPSTDTSTPWRSPHHCRAAANPVKFAIWPPVTSTPSQSAGNPKSSRSQRREISSSLEASGLASQPPAFWSSSDVSQSAPSAAGVVPPITQWKKRGPEERTCASSPPSISWSSAASVPNPSSGRGPPKASAASLERASRTGAVGSDARYASASRATRSSAARLSAGCSSGSDTLPNLQCRAMRTAIPIAAGAAAAGALAWGHFEAGWVRLEELDCPLERLPPELAGVRIAHLSDFHLGFPSRGEQAVLSAVDWVSSRKPDLVFVSGDLLSRRQGEPLLRELLARLPNCYAVLGNHDFAETKDPFASRSPVGDLEPATLLLDEAKTVELRGRRVQIVGVDPRSYRRGLAQPAGLADPQADLRI